MMKRGEIVLAGLSSEFCRENKTSLNIKTWNLLFLNCHGPFFQLYAKITKTPSSHLGLLFLCKTLILSLCSLGLPLRFFSLRRAVAMIVLFLVDTSASMSQKTSFGMTLLDCAKVRKGSLSRKREKGMMSENFCKKRTNKKRENGEKKN